MSAHFASLSSDWRAKRFLPSLSTSDMCMCPELPGRPSRGFAMKHGVIPNWLPSDLTVSLWMLDPYAY